MAKQKTETEDREAEALDKIKQEALHYGYHLAGTLPEMQRELRKIKKELEGKPSCFRRMYAQAAPECRVCHLVHQCADRDVPHYIAPNDLEIRACPSCEAGHLSVEILDDITADVVDYGCTTSGCTYTLISGRYRPASEAELKRIAQDAKKSGRDPVDAILSRIKHGTAPADERQRPVVQHKRTGSRKRKRSTANP